MIVCSWCGSIGNSTLLMFVCSCCGSIGNSTLYACTYVRLFMLWLYWEFYFICMHLRSFVHVLALSGILLYIHAFMFVSSCCGSIGRFMLVACTYIRFSMLWLKWLPCFKYKHLCSFGHAVALLGILFICIHLCSFGHVVALLAVLLYTHTLMFVC